MVYDYRQRYEDVQETLRTVLDGRQVDIWTALPGIIQSFDPVAVTVTVQPAIQAVITGGNLSQSTVNLPILPDVPVVFPRGGTYTLTFPIQMGDECLVVFSSRCIDNWWSQGGIQSQFELRMHDLSDGFAILGPFSQPKVIKNISTTTTQFRTNDGTIFVEIDQPNKKVNVINNQTSFQLDGGANTATLVAPTSVKINTPNVEMTGNLKVDGSVTVVGDATAAGVSLDHHRHSSSGGTGTSGPPVGGS